jgi:hypothetical protein
MASLTSLTQVRSFGASPRTAAAAVRRKFDIETPGTSTGYCMARKRPARARSSTRHREDVLAVEGDRALGDLVLRVAGDRVRQRRLAGAVGAHDGVGLAGPHGEVDALEDLDRLGVGIGLCDIDVQVADFQGGHQFSFLQYGARYAAVSGAALRAGGFEFGFDGGGQAIAQLRDGDLGDDLAEEAADHQSAGLVLGDAAGLQVEQLLIVETSGGTGVSGADDLARSRSPGSAPSRRARHR